MTGPRSIRLWIIIDESIISVTVSTATTVWHFCRLASTHAALEKYLHFPRLTYLAGVS